MNLGDDADVPWIVLVGPSGCGKSSVGSELSASTGRSFVDLDACADEYYDEVGWSVSRLRKRIATVGRPAAEAEWEPARAHAVVRAVVDHPGSILALGAGHTSYRDPEHLSRVRSALSRCPDVVRLLPCPDRERALAILRQRCVDGKGRSWIVDGHDFLAQWLDDLGASLVATRTIYNDGETPAKSAARLMGR